MSDQRGHSGKDPKTGPGTQAETPGEGQPGWEPVTPGDATNEAAGRPDGDAAKTRLDDVIQEAARAGAAKAGESAAKAGESAAKAEASGQPAPDDADEADGARDGATDAHAGDSSAALAAEVEALKDQLARTEADRRNERRRLEKEKQDASAYAITSFSRDLLSVADFLRMALDSMPDDLKSDPKVSTFYQGVEMTEKELQAVLQRQGIKQFRPEGEAFDPNRHQAMGEVASDTVEPGKVAQVLKPGYVIKDRLLRAAMVNVAKAPQPGAEAGEDGPAQPGVDREA
ncbi:nucleotide exchange factor GrpE [Rhodothalassium salexigens]|uniref:nucleotide exchange factor GrpE n=1 Tax=Rhodothalassium salexigens TaxID=1086 RepID=UPI001913F912|nr:nucleotide exchange factor GrpE [Rhodothalassium salexigens]MBK5922014.1 nucleotide exchange factor GrpE [Rhodothalassium salexigens]